MIDLCKAISANPEMTGVHLSDNGLSSDLEFKLDIMGLFGVPTVFLKDNSDFDNFMTNSIIIQSDLIK